MNSQPNDAGYLIGWLHLIARFAECGFLSPGIGVRHGIGINASRCLLIYVVALGHSCFNMLSAAKNTFCPFTYRPKHLVYSD